MIIRFTPHPDLASGYISSKGEIEEAIAAPDFGANEFMIDYEGRSGLHSVYDLIDIANSVHDKIGLEPEAFKFPCRIPSPTKEGERITIGALSQIIEANVQLYDSIGHIPMTPIIVPNVNGIEDQGKISEILDFVGKLGREGTAKFEYLKRVLWLEPLIEGYEPLSDALRISQDWRSMWKRWSRSELLPGYPYTIFLGASDSAMHSGYVTTSLSLLKSIIDLERGGFRTILGIGTLPFRGGLNKESSEGFLESRPTSGVTIQAALRYDHDAKDLKKIIENLKSGEKPEHLKRVTEKLNSLLMSEGEDHEQWFINMSYIFNRMYDGVRSNTSFQETVLHLSSLFPRRRDRANNNKYRMRAIQYTGSLYAIGAPPEFIGTGKGLEKAAGLNPKNIEKLRKMLPGLKDDLQFSARYLSLDAAKRVLPEKAYTKIENDVRLSEKFLGLDIGPKTKDEQRHADLSQDIVSGFLKKKNISDLIIEQAKLRRALG